MSWFHSNVNNFTLCEGGRSGFYLNQVLIPDEKREFFWSCHSLQYANESHQSCALTLLDKFNLNLKADYIESHKMLQENMKIQNIKLMFNLNNLC